MQGAVQAITELQQQLYQMPQMITPQLAPVMAQLHTQAAVPAVETPPQQAAHVPSVQAGQPAQARGVPDSWEDRVEAAETDGVGLPPG